MSWTGNAAFCAVVLLTVRSASAQQPSAAAGDIPFGPPQQTEPGAHLCVLCDLGANPQAPRWLK
jgi:hypothetical protein